MRLMIILAALFMTWVQPVFSQEKEAALFAEYGGRVTGAAKACGVDGDQVTQAGAKVLIVTRAQVRGKNPAGVNSGFSFGQKQGERAVVEKRIGCDAVRTDFRALQAQLTAKMAQP